jgi:tripartite-type tricarboxylate transporter receptor subunit TctC
MNVVCFKKTRPLTAAALWASALLALGSFSTSTLAANKASDAEDYFKGKTITLIIPLGSGGTVDLIARYFTAEFGKFIPGNPRIVARNVTPRTAGTNFVAKSAPDGFTLGISSSVLYQEQYDPSSDFDVAAFRYIGATNTLEGAWFVQGKLPYDNVLDAKGGKTPIRMAVMPSAKALTSFDFTPLLIAEAFDLPLQAIPISSTGLGKQLTMLERDEIDGIHRGIVYYQLPRIRPGWIENRTVKPFAFVGLPGTEMWPSKEGGAIVPNVTDLIEDPELKDAWNATVLPSLALWVPFYLPPNTPDHIVQVYRSAFDAAMADPTFRRGYEAIEGMEARPVQGADAQKTVEQYAAMFRDYLPRYEPLATKLFKKYTQRRNR